MKAYRIVLGVIDFEGRSKDEIKWILEEIPLTAGIMSIEELEIGEWRDDHPLNFLSTAPAEWKRIFATKGKHE